LGFSDSSGFVLYLSPGSIDRSQVVSPAWRGFEGPAIVISRASGENSGRYRIAEVIARVFPDYRPFSLHVMDGVDHPLPSGPYPKDALRYRSKKVVEYKTPAQTEGLGTLSSLRKNDSPIAGVAILVGEPPELVLLSVRLPIELHRLSPLIIRQAEREATDHARN
jgi:hypothetical protein